MHALKIVVSEIARLTRAEMCESVEVLAYENDAVIAGIVISKDDDGCIHTLHAYWPLELSVADAETATALAQKRAASTNTPDDPKTTLLSVVLSTMAVHYGLTNMGVQMVCSDVAHSRNFIVTVAGFLESPNDRNEVALEEEHQHEDEEKKQAMGKRDEGDEGDEEDEDDEDDEDNVDNVAVEANEQQRNVSWRDVIKWAQPPVQNGFLLLVWGYVFAYGHECCIWEAGKIY
jgi:F0F1-type ATP synthase epsilon subunit